MPCMLLDRKSVGRKQEEIHRVNKTNILVIPSFILPLDRDKIESSSLTGAQKFAKKTDHSSHGVKI